MEYEVKGTADAFILPQELTPICYLDPFVQGGVFFNRLEVCLDGIAIQPPGYDDFHATYQHCNRLFTTEEIRREKYGEPILWMSKSLP